MISWSRDRRLCISRVFSFSLSDTTQTKNYSPLTHSPTHTLATHTQTFIDKESEKYSRYLIMKDSKVLFVCNRLLRTDSSICMIAREPPRKMATLLCSPVGEISSGHRRRTPKPRARDYFQMWRSCPLWWCTIIHQWLSGEWGQTKLKGREKRTWWEQKDEREGRKKGMKKEKEGKFEKWHGRKKWEQN